MPGGSVLLALPARLRRVIQMSRDLHPIVAQLKPNPEQRPAVETRCQDVVVTAGAGTGKTRTLVARYLSLLAEGLAEETERPGPPDSRGMDSGRVRAVVAITFTRKAAREMRSRVRAEVQCYLAGGDMGAGEREHWQEIYAELDAARIGTIHSLCSEILRAHPAEANVDPRFRVLEEGQLGLLRQDVLDEALAWAADDPEVAALFSLLGGARALRGVVEKLLAQRLDATAAFGAVEDDPLPVWREVLRQRRGVRLRQLIGDAAFREAVDVLCDSEPTDGEDAMAVQRRRALRAIAEANRCAAAEETDGTHPDHPPGATEALAIGRYRMEQQIAALSQLDDISLVGGSYKAWRGGKAERTAVKDALRALRGLWRDYADFLSLELNPRDEVLAQSLPGLRVLFRFACERYRAAKENERALDFDDLEAGALRLFRDHPTVRARWQSEVAAILVDEFQDTNQRQRDLVRFLAGDAGSTPAPGRLFIVGDAKQSIYRFRGADVTVFREEREAIARAGGRSVELRTSYRAHRGLVEALNDLLRPVLGEEADPYLPWAEPFAPIAPHRQDPAPGVEAPYVEFHLTVGSKSAGGLDRAARALVARVAELVTASEGVDGLCYDDVAILCRSSTSFETYEDALDEAGLPYVTVAGRGFYDRPEIRDLLNGLRALADPTDDLALVGLLRSPAVALSDIAIYRLVSARDAESAAGDYVKPLWDVLRRGGGELDALAEQRAARAVALVHELHTMAGRTVVGDLLKAFLDATGYRAALLKAGQQRAVRNVDKLLGDAHASGLVGVGAFLEYLSGLQVSSAREGEARAEAGGAVQIMSVHQAKGLQFPVVVLGDATWSRGRRGGGLLLDADLGVVLPMEDPDGEQKAAVYHLAEAREADQGAAESDRLLYVAATRVQEKLLVSGCIGGIRRDGTPYRLGGWLGQLGRPLGLHEMEIPYEDEGSLVHRRELRSGETGAVCLIYEPGCVHPDPAVSLSEVADSAEVTMPPPLLEPVVPEEGTAREVTQRVWPVVPRAARPKAPARVVGELVHEALAAWRLPDSMDDQSFDRWVWARARAAGLVDGEQIAHAVRRSRRLLLRFRGNRLFEILDTADRRLHEVPYSLEEDGRVQRGKIDLLYRRDGEWTIVEFKTDEVRSSSQFRRVLDEKGYEVQARQYAAAAGRLLGVRPRCLLCMLDDRASIRTYFVPEAGRLKRVNL